MTPTEARELLDSLGFRLGVDSTDGHPHRAEIKAALNALRDASQARPIHEYRPIPPPVKRPRRPEEVPPRGERPGFMPPEEA